ncbi:hypothetical protein BV20DRAFT_323424 [Pilatotrama ljubarskyi]|nr:hypothetical protein BV20DRAFT_323424 [Pilatotrama ljubarskyi]
MSTPQGQPLAVTTRRSARIGQRSKADDSPAEHSQSASEELSVNAPAKARRPPRAAKPASSLPGPLKSSAAKKAGTVSRPAVETTTSLAESTAQETRVATSKRKRGVSTAEPTNKLVEGDAKARASTDSARPGQKKQRSGTVSADAQDAAQLPRPASSERESHGRPKGKSSSSKCLHDFIAQ